MVADKQMVEISVVIPTLNRTASLERALRSIAIQTICPRQIIIIDQSETPFSMSRAKIIFNTNKIIPQIQIIHRPDLRNKLTEARNFGIKTASCQIIQFMDDDSCLENLYFEGILPYLADKRYGAVCGRIIEPKTRFHFLARYFHSIFHLGEFRQIREEWYHEKYPKAVETNCLPGVAIFHRKVLDDFEFDPNLPGGYLGDDIEISFRASKKYTFLLIPRPKIRHLPDKTNRATPLKQSMDKALFYKYHFNKNISKTFANKLAFAWLILGFVLHAIAEMSPARLAGTFKGLILKT